MRELMVALVRSLIKNGVKAPADVISFFEDNGRSTGDVSTIILDFSEHDNMVSEEKDKRIAELERDLKEYKDEVIAVRKNLDEMMEGFRNGIKPYVDLCQMHERIAELEKENAKLEKMIQSMRETRILLRQRCKGEAVEFFDRNMFGSLIISSPSLEDSKRISELEDRNQSDCIRINQLLTTIDVLTERYQKLREVHGV